MRVRTILIVVLALVFGTSAAFGVIRLRKSGLGEQTVPVVVATQDVPRFTTVTTEMVRVRQFPRSLAPPGALARIEDAVDRVTDSRLAKDSPILDAELAPREAGRGMAAVIPKGMRAVTIKTPNIASKMAGFVLPGNKVDVLFTLRTSYGPGEADLTGGSSTVTLLQNVEILAVDTRIEATASGSSKVTDPTARDRDLWSVTLLVTPEQAAQLDLAQNNGTLYLALRNPLDTAVHPAGTATLKSLRPSSTPNPAWAGWLKAWMERTAKAPAPQPIKSSAEKAKEEKEAVAVAPYPRPVPEPPPEKPLRIRTLRAGAPGQVFIE